MRRILLATVATATIFSAVGLISGGANALTQTAPSALREAADSTNLAQDVRWVCRSNYYGRRHCWWEPGYRRHLRRW